MELEQAAHGIMKVAGQPVYFKPHRRVFGGHTVNKLQPTCAINGESIVTV